jgi:2,3-dihydroxybiphenyl 1,2-dioxygenase
MGHDLELGYLGIEVADPAAVGSFLGDVVGLVPGEPVGDASTWRNDDKAYRIVVQPGPSNDATVVGLEAVDDDAFDRTLRHLEAAGYDVTHGTDNDLASRRVARMARTTAPWGVAVEIVTGLPAASTAFASPTVPGGFLTEGVGFGHVVFATTRFDEALRFLADGLGFIQSDWIETQIADGIDLEVRFLHCNARHHTVALARAPFELPQTLHHFMVETRDRDGVGAVFDRVWATDLTIANGLGRHDNDGMFSFYVVTPAGFQVEVGHGARTVTDPWHDNRRYGRISLWGHQPVARP